MTKHDVTADSGRNETEEERLDRKWNDLLQELRVMQTGAQLTAGFLLTLPFQEAFEDLDDFQRGFYLALVVLAALTTVTVLAPVAVHRKLSGQHAKAKVVDNAHRLSAVALGLVGTLITGISLFIFDVVVSRTAASVTAVGIGAVVVLLLAVRPWWLERVTQAEQG